MKTLNERESRFLQMIRTKRPDMSPMWRAFCRMYLEPEFGLPDASGNYLLTIGEKPRVMFAAHSDTVHNKGGFQKVALSKSGIVSLASNTKSNCLGADCTTGIHIILEMVKARVPGMYAIFAAEEIGCIGSRDFVKSRLDEIAGIDCVISLDRKGTESIITHQMGKRTASDSFALDLARVLDMPFRPDPSGAYTDSNEFARHVSECTNLSVGYTGQHSKAETQDLRFLEKLTDQMIQADWSSLKAYRDCSVIEPAPLSYYSPKKKAAQLDWLYGAGYDQYQSMPSTFRELVREYPNAIADWLEDSGLNLDDVLNELGLLDRGSRYGY